MNYVLINSKIIIIFMFFLLLYVPKALFSKRVFASHLLLARCGGHHCGGYWQHQNQGSPSSGQKIAERFLCMGCLPGGAFSARESHMMTILPAKQVSDGWLIKADEM